LCFLGESENCLIRYPRYYPNKQIPASKLQKTEAFSLVSPSTSRERIEITGYRFCHRWHRYFGPDIGRMIFPFLVIGTLRRFNGIAETEKAVATIEQSKGAILIRLFLGGDSLDAAAPYFGRGSRNGLGKYPKNSQVKTCINWEYPSIR